MKFPGQSNVVLKAVVEIARVAGFVVVFDFAFARRKYIPNGQSFAVKIVCALNLECRSRHAPFKIGAELLLVESYIYFLGV